MDDISDSTRVLNMIFLVVGSTALLIMLIAVYTWIRGQRKKRPLDDIDWEKEKEKEKLLLLASEKKESRKLNKSKDHKEEGRSGDGVWN